MACGADRRSRRSGRRGSWPARPAAEAGLEPAQESGDEWFVAWALNALATVQPTRARRGRWSAPCLRADGGWRDGKASEACSCSTPTSRSSCSGSDDSTRLARYSLSCRPGPGHRRRSRGTFCHVNRGIAELLGGDHEAARAILLECVRRAVTLGDSMVLADGNGGCGVGALEGNEGCAVRLFRLSSEQLGVRSGFYSLVPLRSDLLEPLDERWREHEDGSVGIDLLSSGPLEAEIVDALSPEPGGARERLAPTLATRARPRT